MLLGRWWAISSTGPRCLGAFHENIFCGVKCNVAKSAKNSEHTAIYKLWSKAEVRFVKDKEFAKELRYREHENGSLVTIFYATDYAWSKRFRDKEIDGQTPLELLVAAVPKLFEGRPFLWQANKDCPDDLFGPPAVRTLQQAAWH